MSDATQARALARLADTLLPGRAPDWPAASAVLTQEAIREALLPLAGLAARIAELPAEGRAAGIARHEADAPGPFGAALDALGDAYYGTAPVQKRCAALAAAGPWPQSGARFDPALLDGVRARAARR